MNLFKNECVIDFAVQPVNKTSRCHHFALTVLRLDNYAIITYEDCESFNYIVNVFESISESFDRIYVINVDMLEKLKLIIPETTASIIYNYAHVPAILFPEEVMTKTELDRFNYTKDDNLLQAQPSYSLDRIYINIQCVKLYMQKKLL